MDAAAKWEDYRYVLAIAETGSLSGAARALGVNHATVYRRLEKLESRFGERLFAREAGGYSVTPAGAMIAERAAQMRDVVADAERQLLGRSDALIGTLRLTTTDVLLSAVMPVMASFRRSYPGLILEISTSSECHNLTRRDADIALRPTFVPPEHWVGKPLGTISQAVYTAASAIMCDETPWVGPDAAMGYRTLERWMKSEKLDERVGFRADSTLGMASAIRAGVGQGVLPCYLADTLAGLERVGDPIPELATPLWLLTHPDMRRAASVRALFEVFSSGFALP